MTRFIWWTLVWFGLDIVSYAVSLHYMGGWAAYKAEYSDEVRSTCGLLVFVLWLVLWFTIIKKETP